MILHVSFKTAMYFFDWTCQLLSIITYALTNRGVAQVKLGAGLVQVAGAAVLRRVDGAV